MPLFWDGRGAIPILAGWFSSETKRKADVDVQVWGQINHRGRQGGSPRIKHSLPKTLLSVPMID